MTNLHLEFLKGVVSGAYLTAILIFSIVLLMDYFHPRNVKATPAMRLAGIGLFCYFLSSLFFEIIYPFLYNPTLIHICNILDCAGINSLLLSGFALAKGHYPTRKQFHYIVLPSAVVYVLAELLLPFEFCILGYYLILLFWLTRLCNKILKHDQEIDYYYANKANNNVKSFLFVIICLAICYPMYYIFTMELIESTLYDIIYCALMIAVYGYMSIKILKVELKYALQVEEKKTTKSQKPKKIDSDTKAPETKKESEQEKYNPNTKKQLQMREKLMNLMEVEKVYKDPNLTMEKMVRKMRTNNLYFYNFMRYYMDSSFPDFINGYRISEAQRLLKMESTMKMEEIAKQCGFNSHNSFNVIFKRLTGQSPTQWKKDFHAGRKKNDKPEKDN